MKDEDKTKEVLINELVEMRRQIAELEKSGIQRKRAEEALRESEKKYRILTESSLTGIFIHQDGKYVFVNNKFAEIHGYKPEELLGKEYLTLIHPDDREALRQISSKRLKGEAVPQRYEVRRLRKDGKTIWCEMMVTCIEYGGRPAIMGNIIDITERKGAEEATRLAYAELNQILNAATDGMTVIDKDFKLLRVNECKDGSRVPCFLTAIPLRGSGGELIGIVEDFKNITERKRAEETQERLIEMKRMEEEMEKLREKLKKLKKELEKIKGR